MSDAQSHYDVLDVSEDASKDDIKEAFFKLVREHPPEQDPDAYQRLREAYDVLSDPVSRREYDTMAEYGEEIESLQEEAEALLNQEHPNTQTAIKKLKRATVLGPEISLLRNMLGNAYLMDEQPKKALKQFDEAVDLNPENESHHLNRGYALRELGQVREAEKAFRTVWEEDKGNYAAARGVAGALADRERFRKAHEVLDEAIWADDTLDFEDFFCYYDKIHLYAAKGETKALERALDTVTNMAETPDDRRYAAFMLAQTSEDLYSVNQFGLSHRFSEAARELDDDNSMELDEAVEHVEEMRELEEALDTIMESNRYHEAVQQMMAIFYDQVTGAMTEQEADRALDQMVEGMDNLMQADPDNTEIKKSLRRIRSRHPEAFELNEEFFELILDVPDAELFVDDCPHCQERVMAEKGLAGEMECPHCFKKIYSDGEGYGSSSETTTRSRGSNSGTRASSTSSTESAYSGRGYPSGTWYCLSCGATKRKEAGTVGTACPNCRSKMKFEDDMARKEIARLRKRSPDQAGDCFIATAVYGDYDHPDVRQLRRFRDETLRHSAWGRSFIAWYYRYGSGLAEQLDGRRRLKRSIRWALSQFVEGGLR